MKKTKTDQETMGYMVEPEQVKKTWKIDREDMLMVFYYLVGLFVSLMIVIPVIAFGDTNLIVLALVAVACGHVFRLGDEVQHRKEKKALAEKNWSSYLSKASEMQKEIDHWRHNHDHQVHLKRKAQEVAQYNYKVGGMVEHLQEADVPKSLLEMADDLEIGGCGDYITTYPKSLRKSAAVISKLTKLVEEAKKEERDPRYLVVWGEGQAPLHQRVLSLVSEVVAEMLTHGLHTSMTFEREIEKLTQGGYISRNGLVVARLTDREPYV